MTDEEKSQREQGQIERAQRLRAVIENLKAGKPAPPPVPGGESLKEQIEERAQKAKQAKARPRRK